MSAVKYQRFRGGLYWDAEISSGQCPNIFVSGFYVFRDDEPIVIGSNSKLTLSVNLRNNGDSAYYTSLLIYLPTDTRLEYVPGFCFRESSVLLTCDVDNTFRSGLEVCLKIYYLEQSAKVKLINSLTQNS